MVEVDRRSMPGVGTVEVEGGVLKHGSGSE
jgi:hypothetical protein